jgi:hypothetical protein
MLSQLCYEKNSIKKGRVSARENVRGSGESMGLLSVASVYQTKVGVTVYSGRLHNNKIEQKCQD